MDGQLLKKSILQMAIEGKLVPQNPEEESAQKLLERIEEEREKQFYSEEKPKRKGVKKKSLLQKSCIYQDNGAWYERVGTNVVDISEEIPFEIPESWEWVRVSQIMEVKGGKRIPLGSSWTTTKTEHIYIRVTDMKNGTIIDRDLRYITDDVYEKIKNYTISKDELYITVAGTIGAVGCVPEKFDGMNLTENADKFTNITINRDYIIKCFSSPFVQNQIKSLINQMAQPKLSIRNVLSILFPLPPLEEQKRIVKKLKEVLPLVDEYGKSQNALNELNEGLPERLKRSVLQEAIQGKLVPQINSEDGVAKFLERVAIEKKKLVDSGNKKKKDVCSQTVSDEEVPFEIPETWKWMHFESVAQRIAGKTPQRGATLYWRNPVYPWVSISDMRDYGHVKSTKEGVSEKGAALFNSISSKGSLLMSFKLTVGRTAILDIDAYHNEAIITVIPYYDKNEIFRDYLFTFLPIITSFGDSKDAIKGATLNAKSIAALMIPVPPLEEQKRIVEKVKELFSTIDSMNLK